MAGGEHRLPWLGSDVFEVDVDREPGRVREEQVERGAALERELVLQDRVARTSTRVRSHDLLKCAARSADGADAGAGCSGASSSCDAGALWVSEAGQVTPFVPSLGSFTSEVCSSPIRFGPSQGLALLDGGVALYLRPSPSATANATLALEGSEGCDSTARPYVDGTVALLPGDRSASCSLRWWPSLGQAASVAR